MNNMQMTARVGLFFALGVALIWVTFETLSRGKLGHDDGYALVTQFHNLKELKVGDDVRMAGVRIGSVQTTRLNGHHAEAVLLVDKKVQIAKDSHAIIAMNGLLGSNYVSLDLGSENIGFYEPGTLIHSEDTPDLNTLVSQMGDIGKKVDEALSGFSNTINGKDGGGLIGKIDHLVDDNKGKIGEITTNLQQVTEKLNRNEGTLGKLVNDPKLHNELLATVAEIKGAAAEAKVFVAQAQTIIDQVKSGEGALGTLLYDKKSGENIKITAQNLRELSDKLNQGKGTLGKLMNDDSLFNEAKGAMHKLDSALDGMADQGPITAVGTAAKALF